MDPNAFWEVVGSNIFWGIVGSIVGALAVFLVQYSLSRLRERHSFLTGEWEQTIYNDQGIVDRRDKVIIRHEGDTFKGRVNRLEPVAQAYRSWHLQGRIQGNMIFCIFWSTNLRKDPGSYGTIQLHMIDHSNFTGFYVRLVIKDKLTEFSESFIMTKLQWKRLAAK